MMTIVYDRTINSKKIFLMTSKLNTDKTTCLRQKIKRIKPLVKTGEHSLMYWNLFWIFFNK